MATDKALGNVQDPDMPQCMESQEQYLGSYEFLKYVPAGAYEVDKDGSFLYCNQEAAHILGYSTAEALSKENIYNLYFDRKDRDKLLEKMRKEGGRMRTEGLRWRRKNGLEVVVNDYAEFVYDSNGMETGVRGIFVNATYQRLFDDLNAGVFRIGPDRKTVQSVNIAVARIFGFKSPKEMEGQDITKYYKEHEDFEKFINILKEKEKIENYPLEMKTVDGKPITISVNCRLLKDEKGEIIGREGTFTDITEQKKFEKLLQQPLGVYEATLEDGNPVIRFCNDTFVEMFGCKNRDEVIGMNIHELYANEEDIQRFEDALSKADQDGKPLTWFLLKVKRIKKCQEQEVPKEEDFWIEIFCYATRNEKGEIIGRKGIIMDVSDRIELENVIQRREGIQRFIHGLISPIMSIHSTSQVLAKEIERRALIEYGIHDLDKFYKKRSTFVLCEEIRKVSEILTKKVEETVSICRTETIPEKNIRELTNINENLKKEIKDIVRRIIEVRKLHKDVYDSLRGIYSFARTEKSVKNSRSITDSIRSCFTDLSELDSIYILYLTQSMMNKSKITYHDVEGLRQLMMRIGGEGREQPLEFERTSIVEIIEEIIDMYQIDAFLKGITIKLRQERIPDIEIARDPVERMFSYIIQNAVKYSFEREGYISIDLADRGENIEIKVDDYGVGILADEIKSGKIFEYGYRGKFSIDRNRTGSGIGLSEAKRIAEAHGGTVNVRSFPVGDPAGYVTHNTPHITTVSIFLPKKQKEGGDTDG